MREGEDWIQCLDRIWGEIVIGIGKGEGRKALNVALMDVNTKAYDRGKEAAEKKAEELKKKME